MIFIKFVPPTTQEWIDWVQKCRNAQKELDGKIANSEEAKAKSSIYGALKESVYIERTGQFAGKCAFCEEIIYSSQHGDIEHFRPKAGVKDLDNKPIVGPDGKPHPGYFWLAYDFTNFLPSCQLCNQPSSGRSDGNRIGKWNAFPLVDGTPRAMKPGEEALEQPLLINPTIDDPSLHLGFHDKSGVVFPVNGSLRGTACVEIFGLNNRDLPRRRLQKYSTIRRLHTTWVLKSLSEADVSAEVAEMDEILAGRDEYAMAGRRALEDAAKALRLLVVPQAATSSGPT
jgi:hypothetical protein